MSLFLPPFTSLRQRQLQLCFLDHPLELTHHLQYCPQYLTLSTNVNFDAIHKHFQLQPSVHFEDLAHRILHHNPREPIHVRGLYIANVQYSSFCGCALGLTFGVLDIMEVEVQDREQVEVRERNSRGTRDRGRRQNKETTNAQTCDDMWMNMFYADTSCDTLSHNVMCAKG